MNIPATLLLLNPPQQFQSLFPTPTTFPALLTPNSPALKNLPFAFSMSAQLPLSLLPPLLAPRPFPLCAGSCSPPYLSQPSTHATTPPTNRINTPNTTTLAPQNPDAAYLTTPLEELDTRCAGLPLWP